MGVVAPTVDVVLEVVGVVPDELVVDVPVVLVPLAELLLSAVVAVLVAAAVGDAVGLLSDEAESWRPLNLTPDRLATELSSTSRELVSASAGKGLAGAEGGGGGGGGWV